MAAVIGAAALPILVVCAILVWWVDGRPVLFRQTRVGRLGRTFEILKFRTMRLGDGALVTQSGDPRITGLGRRLRRTKLDELPQLWNVLRGDMSLVGPRPEVPTFVAAQARLFRAIAPLRPGMTDWASLIFRDEEEVLRAHAGDAGFYQRRLLPRKVALARLYHRRVSWGTDLGLVAATGGLLLGLGGVVPTLLGPAFVARARRGL